MKELALEFEGKGEVRGFMFKQKAANEKAYLYEVWSTSQNEPTHYEVFERKENDRYGCITYPSSPAFGQYAYTEKTYEKAVSKYNELTERVINRKYRKNN